MVVAKMGNAEMATNPATANISENLTITSSCGYFARFGEEAGTYNHLNATDEC